AQPASAFFFCQALATSRILAFLSWVRPSEDLRSSSSYCRGAFAAIQARAWLRKAASCGVSSKFIVNPPASVGLGRMGRAKRYPSPSAETVGFALLNPPYGMSPNSRRVSLAQAVDQRVLPIRETAQSQRERVGAALIHVAIELPGEAHAAVNLDVVLGAVLERLRRADARGGGRLGQIRRIGGERPGAIVAVRPRQRGRDIHVGEHVLDGL